MKKIASILTLASMLLSIVGCEKKDEKLMLMSANAPVLTISNAAPVLDPKKETEKILSFSWTNPDYMFTTGPNSQNVSYSLEVDTVGANFMSANKGVLTLANELSKSFTIYDLNVLLSGANGMNLAPDRTYNFEARVVARLTNSSAPVTSNVVKFSARPYSPPPAVELPTSGKLYLVGDASPGGWDNPVPAAQEFTRVTNTRYELVVTLNGGKSMLMLPVNGSWNDKYGWDGDNNQNIASGDKMRRGGGDIKVPAATGTYKIVADFQVGRFSITPQ